MDRSRDLHQEQRQTHRQCTIDPNNLTKLVLADGISKSIAVRHPEEPIQTDSEYRTQYLSADEMPWLGERGFDCRKTQDSACAKGSDDEDCIMVRK